MVKSVIGKFTSLLSLPFYMKQLNECSDKLSMSSEYSTLLNEIDKAYKMLKHISVEICNDKTNMAYESLRDRLLDCEDKISDKFIIDSNPNFDILDRKYMNKQPSDFKHRSLEEQIKYIVWFVRSRLLEHHSDIENTKQDFNKLHLTNDCKLAANIVGLLCMQLNISCKIIKIAPAFTDEYKLYNGNGFHYFCLIKDEDRDKDYIIDCTYRQFFTLDSNSLERLGVMGLDGCNPGIYMLQNMSRFNTARELLLNGYIEANDDNFKNYLDGFTLSFRNGLYYEWLGRVDYEVPYTIPQYLRFLNGEELLFDYEPIEFLGEQERPLKDNNLNFNLRSK